MSMMFLSLVFNDCCDMQADLCYASAFDDIEEPVSDTLPYVDTDTSSVDMSAAAPDSDTVSGMTGVASAPALLMLTPDDELPLTEAFSDVSLTDSRPVLVPFADHKSHLDDSFYFYQGWLIDTLFPWLSGRTLVFDRRAFAVLHSTYS